MLDFVRKHSKSWLVKVALGLIVLVFIFWGGYSYRSRHESDFARVGDHVISNTEYNQAYTNIVEAYKKQLGPAFSEEFARRLNLKQMTLEALIQHYLVLKGADELGLTATTDEIRNKILEIPAFQNNGRFDKKVYETMLRSMQLSPEMFEQQMADDITTKKAQAFIFGRAVVTEDEILTDHHFNRDQIKVSYVEFDPKSFENQVSVTDELLKNFYNSNQNRYMEPEKREIAYVLLNTEEMAKGIQVSNDEVKLHYDDNIVQYNRPQEVHARHILFRVKPDAPQAEVEKIQADAQKILDEAKKGKDFAELAKKSSQDETTASKGGDLGFFNSKVMDPAFSQAAFSLKAGEISDLVRTPYGFHIIKVEEVRPARTVPLEEVKGDIEQNLKLQKAQDVAYKKVRELRDLAYARKDIDKAAEEMKLTVTGPIWIEMAADQPDSGPFPQQLKAKLFELGQGDVSDFMEMPKGLAVAQLKSIKRSQPIPFETVKDKADKDFRAEQAKVLAQKKASDILTMAKDKKSLADVAKDEKLTLRQSEFFSRQDPDKDLKLLRGEGLNAIFDLRAAKPFPDSPADLGNRFLVCQLQGKTPAAAPTQEESTAISTRLLQQKQATIWDAWLNDLRRNTQVERYKEI